VREAGKEQIEVVDRANLPKICGRRNRASAARG